MGFENVVAAIMVTIAILVAAYTFISGSSVIAETAIESYRSATERALERLMTDIEILNVSYSSGQVAADFKNTGETRFVSFDGFDAMLYGTTESGNSVVEYLNNTSYSLLNELINPGIFDPHETAEMRANVTLLNGSYVLVICTPNAVCDSFEFEIP